MDEAESAGDWVWGVAMENEVLAVVLAVVSAVVLAVWAALEVFPMGSAQVCVASDS